MSGGVALSADIDLKVWKNFCWVRSFCFQELDVVNQRQIDGAKLVAKARHFVIAQRVDHSLVNFSQIMYAAISAAGGNVPRNKGQCRF